MLGEEDPSNTGRDVAEGISHTTYHKVFKERCTLGKGKLLAWMCQVSFMNELKG